MRVRMPVLACVVAILLPCVAIVPTHAAAGDAAAADNVPSKQARSQFDLREFDDFINFDLSVPRPRGPLQIEDRSIRTVHGQVLDHFGQPVVGAQVALAEEIGKHNEDFNENYDKTDESGRFLVQGNSSRCRVVVRRAKGKLLNIPLTAEQGDVRVVWPAPRRVRLVVDAARCWPDTSIFLSSTEYWAGMEPLRMKATIDAHGVAILDDVPMGTFRVYVVRPLVTPDGGELYAERELGQFSVGAAEVNEVRLDDDPVIRVEGDAALPGACALIHREQLRYTHIIGIVDAVFCDDKGRFTARVPGPGVYRLEVKAAPKPPLTKQERERQDTFEQDDENPILMTHRFVVDEKTEAVKLDLQAKVDPTIAFVHATLDSQPPSFASWSHSDVQAAWLVGHEDRAGVVKELVRILNDPQAPHLWSYPTLQALGDMTETPGVVDALLTMMDSPDHLGRRAGLIHALHKAESDLPRIIERVSQHTKDYEMTDRWGVLSTLARIAFAHPETKEQVIPVLITGLDDEDERIRSDSARSLGLLQAKLAAPELTKLLEDPSYKVRLWAARALWQTTKNRQPLIEMTTTILLRDDDDLQAKKDAILALSDVPELPQEILDALTTYAANNDKPPFNDPQELMRYQLGMAARARLKEQTPRGD